ncbi:MAG TPA: WYL domain-containing protein [Actinomycetota bacterium]|nr:WYL domain-containing protein [Actinomycetota bacterium]
MGRKAAPGAAKASTRLQRLLAVVPYVVQHPGSRTGDVAKLFDIDEAELLQDLNLLFMTGLPPYGPGDLIDVEVDEGRVWIGMADYFSRPVRLTRSEALALYLRGKALAGAPGLEEAPALTSVLGKLEEGLGSESLGELSGRVAVGAGAPATGNLATIRSAAEERRALEIEYYSAGRGELTARRIDPEQVFLAIGNWYVAAWDHLTEAERLFRVDRIRSITPTGETFQPRGLTGQGRPLYTRTDQDLPVRLVLGPGARWVAEYYEIEHRRELEGGQLEVVLPAKELAWVAKLILRLGGEARVVDPPELVDLVRRTAADTLARYR